MCSELGIYCCYHSNQCRMGSYMLAAYKIIQLVVLDSLTYSY